MNFIINKQNKVPIYKQIVQQIEESILSGELQPDDKLQSVREVAGSYLISALTVKKAYDQLEEKHIITTVPGKGSFVLPLKQEVVKSHQQSEIKSLLNDALELAQHYNLSSNIFEDMLKELTEEYKNAEIRKN
ncbi:GntR family transcriptional regulator [Weissella paramesenteroides]|uniref:GntR family transcriptional regulator n=1 Tax=Weissella paramesenteroides TaxID=1249 RepID=UPI0013DC156A|nr:GntR family transcriptional regulator [Weissella paramesenteroides]NEZ89022.1 GntR family transcriptional regulator [Weissella paramesenteroides]NFB03347.1 GntR family transcriptional regulator [Weissella paramesenteroides]